VSAKNEVELKGGMYTFMSLKLHTSDLNVIDKGIADKVQQAPGFFKDSPVVVDLSVIEAGLESGEDFNVIDLFDRIRKHNLIPVVASVNDKSSPFAAAIALPLLEAGIKRQENDAKKQKTGASKTDAESGSGKSLLMGASSDNKQSDTDDDAEGDTEGSSQDDLAIATQVEVMVKAPQLVTRPVRSGQQVYARDTDLIILGPVGAGAEVLADQNIHVYGPLRGRALCGVSGSTTARIFCQSLEAELVSIDGNFRVLEELPADLRGKPAQIWLDKDRLNIEPLTDTNLSGVIA